MFIGGGGGGGGGAGTGGGGGDCIAGEALISVALLSWD